MMRDPVSLGAVDDHFLSAAKQSILIYCLFLSTIIIFPNFLLPLSRSFRLKRNRGSNERKIRKVEWRRRNMSPVRGIERHEMTVSFICLASSWPRTDCQGRQLNVSLWSVTFYLSLSFSPYYPIHTKTPCRSLRDYSLDQNKYWTAHILSRCS